MMIVMAGFGSIHEYQTDQPSKKAPQPLLARLLSKPGEPGRS
jgi:hypothetical protein